MSEYSNFDLRNFIAEGKKAKEENVDEAGPGFAHDCAAHVVHETYGYGVCIAGQHTLVENAEGKHEVTHYDVFFKEGGVQKNIPVNELDVKSIEEHVHGKRKKNEYSEAEEGDMDEADLNEAPATDILDLLSNPEALMIAATYGAGLFAAVKGGMSAMDYCEAKPDNKLCKMWKKFDKDFTSVKNNAREKGRGYEEGVEETKLTKEAAFKNEIKDILDL
jgi:hypothetical protein